MFEIADTGIGISKEQQTHIFRRRPFVQADGAWRAAMKALDWA
ncbi:MAG: hypothetical protein R3C16_02070 [Hyphomonadaceae bacterium]